MTFEEVLPAFKQGKRIRQTGAPEAYTPYLYYVIFEGIILKVTPSGATTNFDDLLWSQLLADDWEIVEQEKVNGEATEGN